MDSCYGALIQSSGAASSTLKHWYGVRNQRSIHRRPTEQMRHGLGQHGGESGKSIRETLGSAGRLSSDSGAGKHLVLGCFPGNVWANSFVAAFSDIITDLRGLTVGL